MDLNDLQTIKRKNMARLMEEVGLKTTINSFKNVLDVIWSNVFNFIKFDSYIKPRIRSCPGIIASIDTLCGINELCEIKDFPDAYLLIRKLRDNLFLDLFLFEAQKVYEKIPINSFKDINLSDVDELMKALSDFYSNCIEIEKSRNDLKAINKWKNNKLLISKDSDKNEYFQFTKYINYLRLNNEDFNECYNNFLKGRFSKLGLKLNDYVHGNSESSMIIRESPKNVFCNIKETLIELEHLFLVTLFFVDSTLFEAEDYGDYLECGMTPPEGSQYFVNGYILEVLEDIRNKDIKLFNFMTDHNDYSMRIDYDDLSLGD